MDNIAGFCAGFACCFGPLALVAVCVCAGGLLGPHAVGWANWLLGRKNNYE